MKESIAPEPQEEEKLEQCSAHELNGASHLRLYFNAEAARGRAMPLDLRVVVSVPDAEWEATRSDTRALLAVCMDGLIAAIRAQEPVGADLNRAVDRVASLMKQRLRYSDLGAITVLSQGMLNTLGDETMH